MEEEPTSENLMESHFDQPLIPPAQQSNQYPSWDIPPPNQPLPNYTFPHPSEPMLSPIKLNHPPNEPSFPNSFPSEQMPYPNKPMPPSDYRNPLLYDPIPTLQDAIHNASIVMPDSNQSNHQFNKPMPNQGSLYGMVPLPNPIIPPQGKFVNQAYTITKCKNSDIRVLIMERGKICQSFEDLGCNVLLLNSSYYSLELIAVVEVPTDFLDDRNKMLADKLDSLQAKLTEYSLKLNFSGYHPLVGAHRLSLPIIPRVGAYHGSYSFTVEVSKKTRDQLTNLLPLFSPVKVSHGDVESIVIFDHDLLFQAAYAHLRHKFRVELYKGALNPLECRQSQLPESKFLFLQSLESTLQENGLQSVLDKLITKPSSILRIKKLGDYSFILQVDKTLEPTALVPSEKFALCLIHRSANAWRMKSVLKVASKVRTNLDDHYVSNKDSANPLMGQRKGKVGERKEKQTIKDEILWALAGLAPPVERDPVRTIVSFFCSAKCKMKLKDVKEIQKVSQVFGDLTWYKLIKSFRLNFHFNSAASAKGFSSRLRDSVLLTLDEFGIGINPVLNESDILKVMTTVGFHSSNAIYGYKVVEENSQIKFVFDSVEHINFHLLKCRNLRLCSLGLLKKDWQQLRLQPVNGVFKIGNQTFTTRMDFYKYLRRTLSVSVSSDYVQYLILPTVDLVLSPQSEEDSALSTTSPQDSILSITGPQNSFLSTRALTDSTLSTYAQVSTLSNPIHQNSTLSAPAIQDSTLSTSAKKDSTLSIPAPQDSTLSTPALQDSTLSTSTPQDSILSTRALKYYTLPDYAVQDSTLSTPALQNSTLFTSALQGSTLYTLAIQNSTLSAPALQDSALFTSALQESALFTSALQDSALFSSALQGSTLSTHVLLKSSLSTSALQDSNLPTPDLQARALHPSAVYEPQGTTAQELSGEMPGLYCVLTEKDLLSLEWKDGVDHYHCHLSQLIRNLKPEIIENQGNLAFRFPSKAALLESLNRSCRPGTYLQEWVTPRTPIVKIIKPELCITNPNSRKFPALRLHDLVPEAPSVCSFLEGSTLLMYIALKTGKYGPELEMSKRAIQPIQAQIIESVEQVSAGGDRAEEGVNDNLDRGKKVDTKKKVEGEVKQAGMENSENKGEGSYPTEVENLEQKGEGIKPTEVGGSDIKGEGAKHTEIKNLTMKELDHAENLYWASKLEDKLKEVEMNNLKNKGERGEHAGVEYSDSKLVEGLKDIEINYSENEGEGVEQAEIQYSESQYEDYLKEVEMNYSENKGKVEQAEIQYLESKYEDSLKEVEMNYSENKGKVEQAEIQYLESHYEDCLKEIEMNYSGNKGEVEHAEIEYSKSHFEDCLNKVEMKYSENKVDEVEQAEIEDSDRKVEKKFVAADFTPMGLPNSEDFMDQLDVRADIQKQEADGKQLTGVEELLWDVDHLINTHKQQELRHKQQELSLTLLQQKLLNLQKQQLSKEN